MIKVADPWRNRSVQVALVRRWTATPSMAPDVGSVLIGE